jgi:lysozyme family protein
MKKVCLMILLLLCGGVYRLETAPNNKVVNTTTTQRADFRTALHYIMSHEGYYVYHPDDRGGETYCGITRVYQSHWKGWEYLDKHRRYTKVEGRWRRLPIPWNTHFDDKMLDFYVQDFYLDLWVKEGFFYIKEQRTANYVFDFRVNGTVGTRIIKRSLNDLGFKIPITNDMDSTTIATINRANKYVFLKTLKYRRNSFYRAIAVRDTTQRKFLNTWLTRSND